MRGSARCRILGWEENCVQHRVCPHQVLVSVQTRSVSGSLPLPLRPCASGLAMPGWLTSSLFLTSSRHLASL